MADQINGISATYPTAASSGIVARRGLVNDATNRGNVKLPAGTPEVTFVGVSLEKVSSANNVSVQLTGIAVIESDGSAVINPGDALILVGTSGKCKSQALADGTTKYQVIGHAAPGQVQVPATDGAFVSVILTPYTTFGA